MIFRNIFSYELYDDAAPLPQLIDGINFPLTNTGLGKSKRTIDLGNIYTSETRCFDAKATIFFSFSYFASCIEIK